MATIITRSGKGTPLTHAEMDANWNNLNTDKLDAVAGGSTSGFVRLLGGASIGDVSGKNANFTVAANEAWFSCFGGVALVATLPSTASFPGRVLVFKNTAAQTVSSASANVTPITGGAAGTAILPATAGAWAILVATSGAGWYIMAQG